MCTDALYVFEGDSKDSLERIRSCVLALSEAHVRQHTLNVKCKHLQEAGAGEAELRIVQKRAAMVNQIDGGFRTSADWPDWLRATRGIAPFSVGCNYRPPAGEAHAPPVITDAALGSYDVDSDGDSSGAETEDVADDAGSHTANSSYRAWLLRKGVPPQLKKCSSQKLRDFMKAVPEYNRPLLTGGAPTRDDAFEILQQLLGPDLAELDCLPWNLSPVLSMSRMSCHCMNLLASRSLDDDRDLAPSGPTQSRAGAWASEKSEAVAG